MKTTVSKQPLNKYTESQWAREIGWGKCPDKYLWKPKKEPDEHLFDRDLHMLDIKNK